MRHQAFNVLGGLNILAAGGERLASDQRGSAAVITALCLSAVVGVAGLAVDTHSAFNDKRQLQAVADAAAFKAGTAAAQGASSADATQAVTGLAADSGLINGVGGVVVTVNTPPASGAHKGERNAVEVIISKREASAFSSLFPGLMTVSGRSVALSGPGVQGYGTTQTALVE